MIENSNISDDEVFLAIKEFVEDKYDADGNLIELAPFEISNYEELGELIERLRSGVMRKLEDDFLNTHGKDCQACKKLAEKQK